MKLLQFVKWVGTVIEDKSGVISSKRVGFFMCLFILNRASMQPMVNEIVIWAIVALSFSLVGLTMPEWFSELKKPKQ